MQTPSPFYDPAVDLPEAARIEVNPDYDPGAVDDGACSGELHAAAEEFLDGMEASSQ